MTPPTGPPPPSDSGNIPEIDPALFEAEVLSSPDPVIVDFFASWCGPCDWIIPTLEGIVRDHGDRIRVVKLDVDRAPELAKRLRIASVPTLVLFRGGAETARSIGVEPRKVREMAEDVMAGEITGDRTHSRAGPGRERGKGS